MLTRRQEANRASHCLGEGKIRQGPFSSTLLGCFSILRCSFLSTQAACVCHCQGLCRPLLGFPTQSLTSGWGQVPEVPFYLDQGSMTNVSPSAEQVSWHSTCGGPQESHQSQGLQPDTTWATRVCQAGAFAAVYGSYERVQVARRGDPIVCLAAWSPAPWWL